jgi:hypothetical protein
VTGPTGPQGPAGVLAINTGRFWSVQSSTVIAAGATIPLNSGSAVIGTGISLASTGDAVQLAAPGTYLVSYFFQGDAQSGNETVRCALTLNGTTVAGTDVEAISVGNVAEDPAVSNTVVVQVTSANSLLRLVNSGSVGVGHSQVAAGVVGASVNVVRLS